ncbi:MAG: 50S ribosomal protein L13 [Alphaproteobacteria bacterium]
MKTISIKPSEVQKTWYIVDATDLVLGRMATEVAKILRGKNKATYTPHVDCGDNVIIINAEKVYLTGNKLKDKVYYWHTGHPGGIKSRTAGQLLDGDHPDRVIKKAIERMIPNGPLGRQQLRNLRVVVGSEHPYEAQKPTVLDLAKQNPKNVKRG